MSDTELLLNPKMVAQRLGVSASGLRRLAGIYEGVYGEIEKDNMGGRKWTAQDVARLETAKRLVEAGKFKSIEAALSHPEEDAKTVLEMLPKTPDELMFERLSEFVELAARREKHLEAQVQQAELVRTKTQEELERARSEVLQQGAAHRAEMERITAGFLARLEGLLDAHATEFRGAQEVARREVEALRAEIQGQKRVRIYAVNDEEERLRHMNEYLLVELERLRLEAKTQKEPRRWWQWWYR